MYAIGVDIGGTNIAVGLLEESGNMLGKRSTPYPGSKVYARSIPAIVESINVLLAEHGLEQGDLQSIGLAVPGSIDYEKGEVIDAHNLGYHNFPLEDLLRESFPNTPIYIENDANAAALAEYYCGAFRGASTGLLITLGTGIGGGLVLNDKLFLGGKKNGFEFGHGILSFGGEPCTCGNLGCIESYCSATALIREGRRGMMKNPASLIGERAGNDPDKVDAKLVIDCARAGDSTAKEIFADYIAHLGAAITTAIAMFDPEVIALGGGVSNAGDFLLKPLLEYVTPRSFFHKFAKIVLAQMGNDAGIVGAAMLCKNKN